jgi:hypothetical protein
LVIFNSYVSLPEGTGMVVDVFPWFSNVPRSFLHLFIHDIIIINPNSASHWATYRGGPRIPNIPNIPRIPRIPSTPDLADVCRPNAPVAADGRGAIPPKKARDWSHARQNATWAHFRTVQPRENLGKFVWNGESWYLNDGIPWNTRISERKIGSLKIGMWPG